MTANGPLTTNCQEASKHLTFPSHASSRHLWGFSISSSPSGHGLQLGWKSPWHISSPPTVLKETQNARPAHGLQLRLHQDQGVIDIRCNIPKHSLTGDDDMQAIGHRSKFWVWEKHAKKWNPFFTFFSTLISWPLNSLNLPSHSLRPPSMPLMMELMPVLVEGPGVETWEVVEAPPPWPFLACCPLHPLA